ncbi:MAG TPA: NAD-dependent deacylase [Candidatus Barnesiella excrementipullorum]|uniref:NAD-dependent protein deacylase n=1 Tax=Candidatus Barnesiella excrementipullorum TaxID=2838479 RepID=A0A9D1VRJ7_9BACT|nr:NAD-dependent deacylase [Candidatus Barnesiella excrementipullorum]
MKKNLVVLTGAGMSAESGISTFRDSGGLWERYRVEDVASIEGWMRNPELVQNFYNTRRKELIKAQPNAGHTQLAALEKEFDVHIITQNVDNLHERAGSTSVLHLHGELMKVRSVYNDKHIYELSPEHCEISMDDRDKYGDPLRPHIVWFGEAVPMIGPAIEITESADIFVVIGTSLNVYPAAGLLQYVKHGVPIYLIDPKPVNAPQNMAIHFIRKGASEGVAELTQILTSQQPPK